MVDADVYLKYLPSVIASAAVCLARYSLGQEAWVSILFVRYTCIWQTSLKKITWEYASVDFCEELL